MNFRTEPGRCSRTREAPPSRGAVSASRSARGSFLIKKRRHFGLRIRNSIRSSNNRRPSPSSYPGTIPTARVIPPNPLHRTSVLGYHRHHRTRGLQFRHRSFNRQTRCTIFRIRNIEQVERLRRAPRPTRQSNPISRTHHRVRAILPLIPVQKGLWLRISGPVRG